MDGTQYVGIDDPLLAPWTAGSPSARARNQRLRRAERARLIPGRVYVSATRYVYPREALLEALRKLPTSYARTLTGTGGNGSSVSARHERRTGPEGDTTADAGQGLDVASGSK
jgi:hypothetical protein